MSVAKIARAAVGVAIVAILGFVVLDWWGDYNSANSKPPVAPVATSTDTSGTPTVAVLGVGVTKIDGVNFRVKPASSAKLIRGLKKGEQVTVLLKEGQWYKVEDSAGKTGWVTANADYVELQKQ